MPARLRIDAAKWVNEYTKTATGYRSPPQGYEQITSDHGKARAVTYCGFCNTEHIVFIYSFSGGGKKCNCCGAIMFPACAVADAERVVNLPPEYDQPPEGATEWQPKGTRAKWVKNCNWDSWTLERKQYIPGNNWFQDRCRVHTFGWVEIVNFGPEAGRYRAGHPAPWDEETQSDAVTLGYFDTVGEGMAKLLEANNPEASGYYC